jgi:hypothetical protein
MHMAEPPPYPDTGDDAGMEPDLGPAPSTPRWLKVFGIAFLVLVLLVAIMMAHGMMAGGHGPF